MKFINALNEIFPTNSPNPSHLKLIDPIQTREDVVYRKNGTSIDKIIEIDVVTGMRVKTTHFDYFDDKKVRSIDEYDRETGTKLRTINYVLYKSIDEYDVISGKKLRTTNFSVKDENKISSVQEYDITTGKIIKIFIYKRDGKTVSIVKEIDPETGKISSTVTKNQFEEPKVQSEAKMISKVTPIRAIERINYNIESMHNKREDVSALIDKLYSEKKGFSDLTDDYE